MNLKGFIHLQRFIELELLIILLFCVATYAVMPAYTSFQNFLASTTQPGSLFCYGETVHARLELMMGMLLGGIAQIHRNIGKIGL